MGRRRMVWTAGAALAMGTAPAVGQEPPPVVTPAEEPVAEVLEPEPFVRFSLSPHFRYAFGADLERDQGKFSVYRTGLDASVAFPVAPTALMSVRAGYEFNRYRFDRPNILLGTPATIPFSEIHILDLGARMFVQHDERWMWFVGLGGRFAGEKDVDVGDAASIEGLAGFTHQFREGRSAGVGVWVSSRIKDDPLIIPIFNVNWQLADRWRVEVEGLRGEIIYTIDERTELGLGGAWEYRRFRLDDDAALPAAIVADTTMPVFVRLGHRPNDGMSVDLLGGAIMFQEFEVSDRHGRNTREFDSDPTLFLGARLRWVF